MSTALLTDRYELTMIDAALRDGTAARPCVFELFARRLPGARRFGVVAGTGRLLQELREFRFGDDELRYLRDHAVVSAETLAFLEGQLFGPKSEKMTAIDATQATLDLGDLSDIPAAANDDVAPVTEGTTPARRSPSRKPGIDPPRMGSLPLRCRGPTSRMLPPPS